MPDLNEKSIDHVYKYVGERLRFYRKRSGIRRNDLARLLGVSPQQYYKYEEGQSKCSLTNLYRLADAFGVPMEAILPLASSDYADEDGTSVPAFEAYDEPMALDMPSQDEAQLVARLVNSFVGIQDRGIRHGIIQLVEATQKSQTKQPEG